jgi:hypothetical protein
VAARQAVQVIMMDEGEAGRGERRQAVIHHVDVQALEVGNVAGDVERQDLPLALGREDVATGEARDDEAALGGAVTRPHDVLVRRNGFQPQRQAQQGGLLLSRECSDAFQLADQRGGVVVNSVQDSPLWSGGSTGLSVVSASCSDADNAQIIIG